MSRGARRRRPLADTVSLPRPAAWATVTAVLLTAAGLLGVAGGSPATLDPLLPSPIPAGVVPVLASTAGIVGAAGLLALRRLLYDRLARRPGPVVITSFRGDAALDVSADEVLADFREYLTGMSLSAPELLPHEPVADGVLDDARTAFSDARPVAAAVLMLVSIVRVRFAYRVSVQLRGRDEEGRCGISVHVSRMPSRRGDVRTVRADDWRDAAAKAAHAVGAYVIPRSRLARRAPWSGWHGLEMPTELFHLSQRSAELVRRCEYSRAADTLRASLALDPQNPHLRIELGQAQEQAGRALEAVATYADLVALESWHDRRLWLRLRRLLADDTSGSPPGWTSGGRHGRDALLIARYRLVSGLTAAERLVAEWFGDGTEPTDLDGAGRARVWLRSYTRPYLRDEDDLRAGETPAEALARLERCGPARFRHFLQYVALAETDALIDDYRWSQGRRRPGMSVSQTSLNLVRLGARLYLADASRALGRTVEGWPSPDDLDFAIAHHLLLKPSWSRTWKEYYGAACVVAVALRRWPADGTAGSERSRRTLALQAVRHLERAVDCTDSGYVGRWSRWLAVGDPDLDPLRTTPEFADFLARYLPGHTTAA